MASSHRLLASSAVSALLLAGSPALALTQPDNTTIPVGPSLQTLFDSRGEQISALNDAATTPETFKPSCALTFNVLQRNAGYKNSFGWYNVTGQKPSDAELHEFLSCTDDVGTVKVLQIKQDPGYAGGEVGFYEATGSCATIQNHDYVFFSEKKYNPDGDAQNPYIHLLIYDSTVTPKAFYFGWEDLLAGGDNDFDDLTTFVTGITCSGGGGACQTGQPGVCGQGTMQCQSGALTCVPSVKPSPEKCDAFDNDCNGLVDDGDLCAANEICDQGTCVPKCNAGEFTCPAGKVCDAQGYCIDPACKDVTCDVGQKCVAGQCVGPCDGVACPHGQVCLVGVCVDPCASITCDDGQVCVAGACVDKCDCAGCDADATCGADGRCIKTTCVGKSCAPGQFCADDGTCKDACDGVVCPGGGACVDGQCTAGSGAGGAGAGAGTGGGVLVGAGGGGGDTGSGTSAGGASGTGGAGTKNGGGGANGDAGDAGGCGCRAAGSDERGAGLAVAALALLVAAARRRRRTA